MPDVNVNTDTLGYKAPSQVFALEDAHRVDARANHAFHHGALTVKFGTPYCKVSLAAIDEVCRNQTHPNLIAIERGLFIEGAV